jgi:hypothetical protein
MLDFSVERHSAPVVAHSTTQARPIGKAVPPDVPPNKGIPLVVHGAKQFRDAADRRAQGNLHVRCRLGADASTKPWVYREPTAAEMQERLKGYDTDSVFAGFVAFCWADYIQTPLYSINTHAEAIAKQLNLYARQWCEAMGPGIDSSAFGHYYPDLCVAAVMQKLDSRRRFPHPTGHYATWVATNYIAAAMGLSPEGESAMKKRFSRRDYFCELAEQLKLGGAHMALFAQMCQEIQHPLGSSAHKAEFHPLLRAARASASYLVDSEVIEFSAAPIAQLKTIVLDASGTWSESKVEKFISYVNALPKLNGNAYSTNTKKQFPRLLRKAFEAFRRAIEEPSVALSCSDLEPSAAENSLKRRASRDLLPQRFLPRARDVAIQPNSAVALDGHEQASPSDASCGLLGLDCAAEPTFLDVEQIRDDAVDLGDIIHRL